MTASTVGAPRDLTVALGGENSLARYFRVAPADAPHAVVTVREGRGGVLVCLTDYQKPGMCVHVAAVRDHLGASAERSTAAA